MQHQQTSGDWPRTSPVTPDPAYTDAPLAHPNLILGSLQLLFWLFFHPAAWRGHVARIDPALRPDFTLLTVRGGQWRHPALRRLLIQAYVVIPVLLGLLALPLVGALGLPYAVLIGCLIGGAIGGLLESVVAGALRGAWCGVAVGVLTGTSSHHAAIVTGLIAPVAAAGIAAITAAAAGLAKRDGRFWFARQLGGTVVGLLIVVAVVYGGVYPAWEVEDLTNMIPVNWWQVWTTSGPDFTAAQQIFQELTVLWYGLYAGMMIGTAAGLAIGAARGWRRGVATGVMSGAVGGVTVGVLSGLAVTMKAALSPAYAYAVLTASTAPNTVLAGVAAALSISAVFVLPYVLAKQIAGPWAAAVAGTVVSVVFLMNSTLHEVAAGTELDPVFLMNFFWNPQADATKIIGVFDLAHTILVGVSVCLGLTLAWWRPIVLYPFVTAWNTLLYRADEQRAGDRRSLLRWHSAFWDEHQFLPLVGLDSHLVLVAERDPADGQAALAYLASSRQRWAAQAAQIELDARRLERCTTVQEIAGASSRLGAGDLEGPASALLRSFGRLSRDVDAALHQEGTYNQRLTLSAVEERLDALVREVTRSSERYALRFGPIATAWRQVVAAHVQALAADVELRQEIDNPYIIGVPLTAQQDIFVGRSDVSARIEQLLLDRRRPPLLLYGQRRMGKTSLLNNLGRLLPSTIVPLFVDMQGPAVQAANHAGFLYNVARAMGQTASASRGLQLPALSRDELAADPFTRFDEWLDAVEAAVGTATVLLTLDEFEALDDALASGRLAETAILGTVRHLIQHRPRFKLLLAGSHTPDEMQHWASYLINVQVVRMGYLREAETRQLIERPVADFALRYEPAASERVVALTRGHPYLTQLLCAEIVALKNEQEPSVRRSARVADVEAAVAEALHHGSFFFADIQRNQVDAAGLAVLRVLAAWGEGAVVSQDALTSLCPSATDRTLDLLIRRDLLEAIAGRYRFQVELIRRWFARDGHRTGSLA
jgi:hypothetical protein